MITNSSLKFSNERCTAMSAIQRCETNFTSKDAYDLNSIVRWHLADRLCSADHSQNPQDAEVLFPFALVNQHVT